MNLSSSDLGCKEEGRGCVIKIRSHKPLVLALPRTMGRYTLDTYACYKQIGCVLLQKQEDRNSLPAGFCSGILNDKEQTFAATHGEFVAVVWEVTILRPYLEGTRFTFRTDHKSLPWIFTMAKGTEMLVRRPERY